MRQYCGVIDCMFRKLFLPRDRVEQGLLYRWTEHWPIHWKSAHQRWMKQGLIILNLMIYQENGIIFFHHIWVLQITLWPLLSVPSIYRVILEQSIRQREAMKVDIPCLDSTSKRVAPQKKHQAIFTTHKVLLSMCMAIIYVLNLSLQIYIITYIYYHDWPNSKRNHPFP